MFTLFMKGPISLTSAGEFDLMECVLDLDRDGGDEGEGDFLSGDA